MLDYRTHTFLAVYRSGSFTRAAPFAPTRTSP